MTVAKELWRDTRFAAGVALGQPFQCLVQVTNRCNMHYPILGLVYLPALTL